MDDLAIFSLSNHIVSEKIPFNKLMGITLESIEDDFIKLKIMMRDEFIGNYVKKTLHGGVISSVIDAAGGVVSFMSFYKKNLNISLEEQKKKLSKIGTVDLRIDYLRPGYGSWFIATGYVLRAGSRVAVARIEFNNDKGDLIAVGTGTYIVQRGRYIKKNGLPVLRSRIYRMNRKENVMSKIAILYCKRIKDHSCIACAKCYKGIKEKHGEFGAHDDEIELVAMTDCGDCPGLAVPRVKLLTEITKNIGRPFDVLHLGTCMKLAMETANCPIDFENLKVLLEKKFGVKVILGTHSY